MTNIDPAIVEAAGRKPAFDRWAEQADAPIAAKIDKYVPAFAAPALYQAIAAAVDAARAEGEKQGAARVREAVEAEAEEVRRACPNAIHMEVVERPGVRGGAA